jgi:hypothetical protein
LTGAEKMPSHRLLGEVGGLCGFDLVETLGIVLVTRKMCMRNLFLAGYVRVGLK